MQGKALWYVAPGRAELREETVDAPKAGEVQVRSLFGAISRGTERLVLAGRVPASEHERMRAPLMAYLCARLPGAGVTVVDIASTRAEVAHRIGADFADPNAAPTDCDLVFHASGTAAGLATALRLAGDETAVVELSWYGTGEVAAPLGEAFHSRRLRLVSSQVGSVAPSHRPRWTRRGRLMAALALLEEPVPDILVGSSIAFDDLPAKLPSILDYEP